MLVNLRELLDEDDLLDLPYKIKMPDGWITLPFAQSELISDIVKNAKIDPSTYDREDQYWIKKLAERRIVAALEGTNEVALTPWGMEVVQAGLNMTTGAADVTRESPEYVREVVEEILLYLFACKQGAATEAKVRRNLRGPGTCSTPLSALHRIEPWTSNYIELLPNHITEQMHLDRGYKQEGDEMAVTNQDIIEATTNLREDLDACILAGMEVYEGSDGFAIGACRLRRIRLGAKKLRGKVNRTSPYMFLYHMYGLREDGTYIAHEHVLGLLNGKVQYLSGQNTSHKYDAENRDKIWDCIAAQRYQEENWSVAVGIADSPTVNLITDPTGIKELFAARDKRPGSKRRDALLTWVSEHWRKNREDPELETYVRKHLRGKDKFTWAGTDCYIYPSLPALEEQDMHKQARKHVNSPRRRRHVRQQSG